MKFLHSKSRLEALSDGVFAFAATLMVVNVGQSTDISSFKEELPNFISFAISFFVMMAIWKVHYNFFRRTHYVDNWIIALNMILLFTVLFYVFPLKFLLSAGMIGSQMSIQEFSQLFQIYSLGFLLIFLAISLMYLRAYRKDEKNENKFQLLFYARHFSIFVFVAFLSIVLSYFKIGLTIGLPGFIYASLGILCYVHAVQFQKKYTIK